MNPTKGPNRRFFQFFVPWASDPAQCCPEFYELENTTKTAAIATPLLESIFKPSYKFATLRKDYKLRDNRLVLISGCIFPIKLIIRAMLVANADRYAVASTEIDGERSTLFFAKGTVTVVITPVDPVGVSHLAIESDERKLFENSGDLSVL